MGRRWAEDPIDPPSTSSSLNSISMTGEAEGYGETKVCCRCRAKHESDRMTSPASMPFVINESTEA